MPKSKALTPQEIYRQRKQREEREKAAFLPPGLINHGNTCFMNSVLQGLLATRLLADLVYFNPIPSEIQRTAAASILSTRSPQLMNGHYFAGKYKQSYVVGMPIGDVFLDTVDRAWVSQANRRKEVLSPRFLLTTLGRKYDQYLDFAQQDAHEFLRILLDAMRMEEFDIIKVRQPPPPPKKKRRTTITPADVREGSPTPAPQTGDDGRESCALPPLQANGAAEKLPLMSFVDMIFGGQLTSILVCQKCKHVSQTYEDFNDISLSLKPEDYANRKRDRFKRIVGRLTGFPSVPVKEKSSLTVPTGVASAPIHPVEMQRSSSVPPTPSKEKQGGLLPGGGLEEPPIELRRRSLELSVGSSAQKDRSEGGVDDLTPPAIEIVDLGSESGTEGKDRVDEDGSMGSDSSHVIVNVTGLEGRHVEFIEPKKGREGSSSDQEAKIVKEKKSEEAAWAKIGRRISLNLGLGRQKEKDKDKKDRERKTRSVDRTSLGVGIIKESEVEDPLPMQKSHSVPSTSTVTNVDSPKSRVSSDQRPPSQSTQSSTTLTSNQDNIPQVASQDHVSLPTPKFPTIQRSKSPKPPKPTAAETEYLRRVLADVAFPQSNPFNIFRPPLLHHDSSSSGGAGEREKDKTGSMWLGLGSRTFSGIEECLRMFTSVEVLDGENMVGCRRCWKIQNGVLQSKKDSDQDDEDDGDDDEPLPVPIVSSPDVVDDRKSPALTLQPPLNLGSPTPSSPIHIQASQSTPTVSFNSQGSRSVSSLPTSLPTSLSDANLTLLKSKPGGSHSDSPSSISIISEGSSMTAEVEGVQQQTPGGLPVPIISTTPPIEVAVTSSPASTDSDSESHYSSASEGRASYHSINRQAPYAQLTGFGQIHNTHSKDSLAIPTRRMNGHHRQVSSETSADEGSSEDDDSETSIGTSVSAESGVSPPAKVSSTVQAKTVVESLPSQVQSSQQFSLQRPPRKPSKPKPVIMRSAYKRYLIATPPPVLVVHLKRFQQTSKAPLMLSFSNGFKKLDDYVSFPEHLDLSPFLAPRKEDYGLGKKSKKEKGKGKDARKAKANPREERCMYRLYAVVVHIGNMLGGHYIAYTALPEEPHLHNSKKPPGTSPSNGVEAPKPSESEIGNEEPKTTAEVVPPERQWAYVSDTHVRLTTLEEVLHSKAYICMYERC